ncbi:MAG: hypothetical protein Q616_SPPC01146G0010, partial [Streptococcus parasanguinis DORA_23_24]
KNTVSNKKPHNELKNVEIKAFSKKLELAFFFLVPFLVPSWKISLSTRSYNLQTY